MKPKVNSLCPCGSGKKYKRCCRDRPGGPETLYQKIVSGKIPLGAQIVNTSGEASSMEIRRASVTQAGETTVLIEEKLVLSTNATVGDRTAKAGAMLSVPIDGKSPGTIATHGNASVSNDRQSPGVALVDGKQVLKASKDGFFVVVKRKFQRNTGLPYLQVLFGRKGQSEALDASGTKPRPHVDFHPDGNGKYVRLTGHDCEIEGQMRY